MTTIRERSETIRERSKTTGKAGENHELVCAEIDKTEQQINQLCEVGMTLRDTTDLAVQINTVSSSLQMSERVLAEASVGSAYLDQPAPPCYPACPPCPLPSPIGCQIEAYPMFPSEAAPQTQDGKTQDTRRRI